MKRWNCILTFAIAACWLSIAHGGKPDKSGGGKGDTGSNTYTMIALDSAYGYANGINQEGEIVGYLEGENGDLPYHWAVGESGAVTVTPLSLGRLGWGRAHDINQAGMIVGEGLFWLNKGSDPVSLTVPLGTGRVRTEAINDMGVMVGSYEDDAGNDHAAAWAVQVVDDKITIAGPIELGTGTSRCFDVNNGNVAVGQLNGVATRWQLTWDGQSLASGAPESLFDSLELISSAAKSINDTGDICGTIQFPGSNQEAFLLMQLEAGLAEVPLPEKDNRRQDTQNGDAFALNNAVIPQVLGRRDVLDLRERDYLEWDAPVLWQGDQAINLEQTIPYFWSAEAINDSGWIVGQGYDYDGVVGFPMVCIRN